MSTTDDSEAVKRYTTKIRRSLNHAVALSLRKDPSSPKSRYIRAVVLVKGVHFYGFHSSYAPFLKVLVADPALGSRVVAMMQNGTIMGTRFTIYESHLNYTLQFLSDFGLYGCGWLELNHIQRRGQDDESFESSEDQNLLPRSPHFRQSRMSLEVDAAAHQILNRQKLVARKWHHKLEIPAPPLPDDPLVLSVRELWEDERHRRHARGLNPSPEMPIDLSGASRAPAGGWLTEARYWDEIRHRIENDRNAIAPSDGAAQTWEGAVMTTFESIEALWEDDYKTWKPCKAEHGPQLELLDDVTEEDRLDDEANIDVDTSFLSVEDLLTEEAADGEADETLVRPFDDTPLEHSQPEPEDEYDEDLDPNCQSDGGSPLLEDEENIELPE
ncbi:hypothetical protein D9757_002931 [Collybiopsis confluens]|uniref:DNA polymerase delta/zeta catalytic subunit N-terminal domain-containing protein n=1 Tax=Collybiopsis confluens TaxID=2823264 RepID=A0A8H5HVU3_9AGAR|nr:hypothetical protein D9757_002931 [Collybiopsis confluens]